MGNKKTLRMIREILAKHRLEYEINNMYENKIVLDENIMRDINKHGKITMESY